MFDIYRQNEQRHRDKAEYWMRQGLPDYAAGSLRKAAKWQAKRRSFEYAMNGAYPKSCIESLMDSWMKDHAKKVADSYERAVFGVTW